MVVARHTLTRHDKNLKSRTDIQKSGSDSPELPHTCFGFERSLWRYIKPLNKVFKKLDHCR